MTEADAGVGSISNLACSVFHSVADIHPTVASYRGTPQATMDLVAGTVDFGCNQIVNIVQHIKTGKLKAYAVTGDKRSPMLPEVPTTKEAGMPQFNLTVWFGLSAPKGTPKPILDKLDKALGVALNDPERGQALCRLGLRRAAAGRTQLRLFRHVLQGRGRALGQGARRPRRQEVVDNDERTG